MQPSAALPLRLAPFVVVLIVLAGCSRWEETRDLGVFRLTTYMVCNKLDWEGGDTYARKMTFCSRVSDFCLEDHYLLLSPHPDNIAQRRWLLVRAERDKQLVRFFDTTTGTELHCLDCAFPITESLRHDAYLTWPLRGDSAVLHAPWASSTCTADAPSPPSRDCTNRRA